MNKKYIYLFILMLLVSFPKEAPANTDILNNVLETINSTLKEVGEVQNKISGKVRKIVDLKAAPAKLLGSIGAKGLLDKAEKIKEMAENIKEKAEKIKEVAETAKEKKDEYMAKYQELNSLATEKFSQANEAFNKYKSMYEEYRGKAQEYMAMGKDIIATGVAVGGAVGGVVNTIKSSKADNTAQGSVKASDIANSLGLEKISKEVKGAASQVTPVDVSKAEMTKIQKDNASGVSPVNRADIISSASSLADKSMVESKGSITVPDTEVLENSKVDITSEDIMENISLQKQKTLTEDGEIKTDVNLKDQLTNSSNNVLKAQDAEAMLQTKIEEVSLKSDKRIKFGETNAEKIDNENMDETNIDAKKASMEAIEKIKDEVAKKADAKKASMETIEKIKAEVAKKASEKGYKEKAKAEEAKSKVDEIMNKVKKQNQRRK